MTALLSHHQYTPIPVFRGLDLESPVCFSYIHAP
jgi:hypothetical protein